MKPGENGKIKGVEYAAKFEKWLSEQTELPGHGGKPCKAEIARRADIGSRRRFYDNQRCKELLESCKLPVVDFVEEGDTDKAKLESRIRELETQVVNADAEKFEMRRKLRKLQHIEQIMESGGRFIP